MTDDPVALDASFEGRGRRLSTRARLALGSLALVAILGALETVLRGPRAPPDVLDWLFALTVLALGWLFAVPLALDAGRARWYWRRFRSDRAAVAGLAFLAAVFVVGVVGPLILPVPRVHPELAYQPPVGFSVPAFLPPECVGTAANGACAGTWAHPLGTTGRGKDVLALVVYGMGVSMEVGLVAAALVVLVGTLVGTVAAVAGGLVDEALMRYVDIQRTFPTFFVFLFVAYLFGASLLALVLIFGLTGWGNTARLVRSEALQRVEEPYVDAARSAGAGTLDVVARHVVPNVSATLVTNATLLVPTLLLAEAGLAFLGVGNPTTPSWGQTIAAGRSGLPTAWWVSTVPGAFLFCTILSFNFVGDALRDALDPRGERE